MRPFTMLPPAFNRLRISTTPSRADSSATSPQGLRHRTRIEEVKKLMSAISDLQAAETAIASAVAGAVAAMNSAASLIANLQSGAVNSDDAQVEAVVVQLNAQAASLS